MLKILLLIISVVSLSGCQKAHLEIFPELASPQLLDVKLTPEQMKEDVDALIRGALNRHPDLAKYADVNNLHQHAKLIKKSLIHPMTRVEFFKYIGKLNAYFGDGHAFLIWPYQEYNLLKERGALTFPFSVKLTKDNQLVVAKGYQSKGQKLMSGQAITHINGVSTTEILANLQSYVGGETKLLREHIVAERFPIMLWAVYDFMDEFELQIEGQTLNVNRFQKWRRLEVKTPEHYYKKLNDEFGYLYLGHFDVEPSEFERFIDTSFVQIRNDEVTKLIIDIRDNPGGNTDTVLYLTSYIADKPFRLVSGLQERLNQENRGWFAHKGEVGEVLTEEWDDWQLPIESRERFKGEVFVAIGPVTYSAAIVFATGVQDHGFATIVGEPTGGFANQSAQGNLFNLPNSKLRAFIATRLLVRPNGDTRRAPVVPDIEVGITTESMLNGKDAVIELILTK